MSTAAVTKERIWAIAQEEFAAKGFAGARVDEIARRADVNKALIYYHFKSKEHLLRLIISHFVQEVLELHRILADGGTFTDPVYRREAFRSVYGFFRQRKCISRIILREMAGGEASTREIILMLEPLITIMIELFTELGLDVSGRGAEITVYSTFYTLLPVLTFVVLEDSMAGYLALDREEALQHFESIHELVSESFRNSLPAASA